MKNSLRFKRRQSTNNNSRDDRIIELARFAHLKVVADVTKWSNYMGQTFLIVLEFVPLAITFPIRAWQLPNRQLNKWDIAGARSWSSVSLNTSWKLYFIAKQKHNIGVRVLKEQWFILCTGLYVPKKRVKTHAHAISYTNEE